MTDQTTVPQPRPLIYTGHGFLRDWTTEVDTESRRLKITRRWLNLRPKTIVDCAFDKCISVGTIKSADEGLVSYGVYVWIATGRKYGILHNGDRSAASAARVADELSNATGIPRLDINAGTI
jgi:hypothetical protein